MNLLNDFITYMKVELNRSTLTIEAYHRDLIQFFDWLKGTNPEGIIYEEITTSDIRAWLSYLATNDSANTIRRKTQSLRAFFKWLRKQKIIKSNPAADVILAKKKKSLPEVVREEEMEAILTPGEGDNSYTQIRNHLILNILYSTGIRQAELLALKDSDINFSSQEMKVTGKRNKQRVIPLPTPLLKEIKEWQSIRDYKFGSIETPNYEYSPLFPGKKGRPLSKMQLYRIVNNGLEASSSPQKSPHILRHSFATAMLADGANLDTVKEMLGHSSLTTTEIYTHLTFEQLRDTYLQAHPRSHGRPENTSSFQE